MNKILILLIYTLLITHICASVAWGNGQNYVLTFNEKGMLNYAGDIQGHPATSPKLNNQKKLQAKSVAGVKYSTFLKNKKNLYLQKIHNTLGSEIKPIYHYQALSHGLLMKLTNEQVLLLKSLPEIKSIVKEPVHKIHTSIGPTWINANQIWDGNAVPFAQSGNKGEGIIVGVLDSGINVDHPSFAEIGPVDGYQHINPFGQGNFVGHCTGGNNDGIPAPNPTVQCNNKLIGTWAFTNDEDPDAPSDNNGHGTHTASTAAGNLWAGPFYDDNAQNSILLDQISGVAPHANIIAYDVCEGSNCASTSAGIDRAIIDGVDVINYSISGGREPWSQFSSDRIFLEAVNAGIFVAVSAGNTRDDNQNPIADSNHLGPWLMTVAASTHNRSQFRGLGQFTGGQEEISPAFSGFSYTSGHGPAAIVYAGDFDNGDSDPEQCLSPFPKGTWTNDEIVLCDRGAIARVLKGAHVAAGGAGGYILGNISGGTDNVRADFHVIPGIHLNTAQADEVRNWLASGSDHSGRIVVSNTDAIQLGDVLADFSLRGPNLSFDVTKPNITAPGVGIIAAINDSNSAPDGVKNLGEVGVLSGTSMSSPHMAGSGALIKAVHPDWSVAEINSAIQMTADQSGRKENNLTPVDADDVGNGRVDLSIAALAGLVLDETYINYINANPNTGGDPKLLNLASMRNSTCTDSCNWTRVFTNKLNQETNWQISVETDGSFDLVVSPTSFTLTPDIIYSNGFDATSTVIEALTQSINVTASNVPTTPTGMSFGTITLTETNGRSPDLHLTVSVNQSLPYGGVAPDDT